MDTSKLILLPLFWLLLPSAGATDSIPHLYRDAARTASVPAPVLYALALQETGVRLPSGHKPWPWTLNIAGEPWRFANQRNACRTLKLALEVVDPHYIDVGLAQVNVGWNGHHFSSPCAGLDPARNLRVAARILKEHFNTAGDWVQAAGRYHRPAGGVPAQNYRRQFVQHVARVLQVSQQDVPRALEKTL